MAIERFVSADEVISSAKLIVPEIDDNIRLYCRQLIYLGVRELGPIVDDIKNCSLKPHDNGLRKPDDCLIIDDIALFDSEGSELAFTYRGPGKGVHKDSSVDQSVPIDLSEDDYYIHMGSNGDHVAYANIRYYGLPVDEYGDIRIPERWILALMMFLRWMLAIRFKSPDQGAANADWTRERLKARSKNKVIANISPLAMRTLDKRYNSMINKIIHNKF